MFKTDPVEKKATCESVSGTKVQIVLACWLSAPTQFSYQSGQMYLLFCIFNCLVEPFYLELYIFNLYYSTRFFVHAPFSCCRIHSACLNCRLLGI